MTEDIIVRMKGIQVSVEGEEDVVTSVSQGRYFFRNGKHFILFEEKVDDTKDAVKTSLKLSKNVLEVTRNGALNTRMVYEQNKKNASAYHTAYGSLLVAVETESFELREEECAIDVKIKYKLEVEEVPTAECSLEIEIRPQN